MIMYKFFVKHTYKKKEVNIREVCSILHYWRMVGNRCSNLTGDDLEVKAKDNRN